MVTRAEPDLINQFYRLIETAAGIYRTGSPWDNVVHGHDFDAENCMASQGAIAAYIQSGCTKRYSPADIRNHQSDFSGGIGVDDVADAFDALGLAAPLQDDGPWAKVISRLSEGRFVWLAVDYRKVPPEYQAQVGGQFDHALGLFNLRTNGNFDLYDSLAKAIRRNVPASAVRPAAEAIALRERGTKNRLFMGATKPSPITDLILRFGGVKTAPYPDQTKAKAAPGKKNVNVKTRPKLGTAYQAGTLANGKAFTAYQVTDDGDAVDGSTIWYGNKQGTRWISGTRLSNKGGTV